MGPETRGGPRDEPRDGAPQGPSLHHPLVPARGWQQCLKDYTEVAEQLEVRHAIGARRASSDRQPLCAKLACLVQGTMATIWNPSSNSSDNRGHATHKSSSVSASSMWGRRALHQHTLVSPLELKLHQPKMGNGNDMQEMIRDVPKVCLGEGGGGVWWGGGKDPPIIGFALMTSSA